MACLKKDPACPGIDNLPFGGILCPTCVVAAKAMFTKIQKLQDAINRAGFEVCQTSGDWTLCNVSAKSLKAANFDLEIENGCAELDVLHASLSRTRTT